MEVPQAIILDLSLIKSNYPIKSIKLRLTEFFFFLRAKSRERICTEHYHY